MYFKTLKEKCEYYRSLTDYRLVPNNYVLVMVDGHRFSKVIKNKFDKPFDDMFIKMMNETAKYLCENIQGAKFAYTQSDEISILITDFDTPMTDSFFSFRLCKMQSLIAAMATAKFNQMYAKMAYSYRGFNLKKFDMKEYPTCTFDCKVWTVPNANDAYAWFLYRQIDCIKNSKAQTAQTYISHKDLVKLTADEMIAKLKDEKSIDWNTFDDGKKYGRIVWNTVVPMEKTLPNGETVVYTRHVWAPTGMTDLKENNEWFKELIPGYYNED